MTFYNPDDYGACGDGVTDDALAFAAMTTCMPCHAKVIIPARRYRLGAPWDIQNKTIGIFGAGAKASTLVFTEATNGIVYSSDDMSRCLTIKDLSIVTTQCATANCGLSVSFPTNQGSAWKNCTIRDVVVDAAADLQSYDVGNSSQNVARWKTGMKFTNVAGLTVDNVHVRGKYSSKDSIGVIVDGWTVDMKITNCIFQFHDVALFKQSALEGFNISGCIGLSCNEFIRLWNGPSHTTGQPGGVWGYIANCHSGNTRRGIDIRGYPQTLIRDCKLYQDGTDPNFQHIYSDRSDCLSIQGCHLQGNDKNNGWNIYLTNCVAPNIANNFLWGRYFAAQIGGSNLIIMGNHRNGVIDTAGVTGSIINANNPLI